MGNKISKLEKEAFLHQSSFEKSDGDGCIDGYLNGRWEQSYKSFKQGAQWQLENMWIPVKEELPNVGIPVFALTVNGNIAVSKMYIPKDCYGTILGEKEWKGSHAFKQSIVAWMPIPKFKKG